MQRQFRPKREPGVEDLREKLNRIKQEKLNDENGVSKNLPPPDPTYNFLKDPMRGDNFDKLGKTSPKKNFPKKPNEANVLPKKDGNLQSNLPGHNKFEINKGHEDDKRNQNWRDKKYINRKEPPLSPKEKPKHEILNQLPLNNIKVEFSGETGKRKCIIDESKIIELPKVDESKFTKDLPHRETQKYYYNRQSQESRSFREKKSDNKKELDKGTEVKQSSNYKKNYKQKKNYKKTTEKSPISTVEHVSEDNATRVENAPCENNDAHEDKATRVENTLCTNNDANEDNATRVENAPCENSNAHEDNELIKSPIVKITQEL